MTISIFRPASVFWMTLAQFAIWYRQCKKGEEELKRRFQEDVEVVSPEDLTVPDDNTVMPIELELGNGVTLQKLTRPRNLDWGPTRDDFGLLMMFKVGSHVILVHKMPHLIIS